MCASTYASTTRFPYACTNNPDGCVHFRYPDVHTYFIFTEALLHCCPNTNTEHENALGRYCSRGERERESPIYIRNSNSPTAAGYDNSLERLTLFIAVRKTVLINFRDGDIR